jgi:DNA repair protein RecO (recombination protein O)
MREQLQPAYLLHRRPYRDGSDLLDVFSAEQGRLGLIARGLNRRRRGGSLAALLQPFRPLLLSFSGRGELLTLTAAEAAGALAPLRGKAMFSAFYLNELLLRLLQRFEAHSDLFVAYAEALGELSEAAGAQSAPLEPALRRFELRLLEELGYSVDLTQEANSNDAVVADATYALVPDFGLRRVTPTGSAPSGCFAVRTAGDRARRVSTTWARAAKRLVRTLLHPHLGAAPLRSRAMFSGASWGSGDGGAVIGIGTDIVEIERVERIWERHGDAISPRAFSHRAEQAQCRARQRSPGAFWPSVLPPRKRSPSASARVLACS